MGSPATSGSVGAVVGAVLFGFFVKGDPAFWGAVLVAFFGACSLLCVARAIAAVRGA